MRPRVINMYGITETTVHVTCRPVGIADLDGPSLIGRPIPDLSLYVLDGDGEPAPLGVPGELHVGGPGLARGYLNLPELTDAKFVTRSVAGAPPQRLYRSGDLARCRDDGDIEYLGRIDQQVKIRGYRIELAEIEAVLAGHPSVAQCVVLAREDQPGDTRLVGYIVAAQPGVPFSRDALRAHLRERLPDYMVPAAFVPIAAIPLTTNGKIDRSALPAPSAAIDPAEDDRQRRLTEREQVVLGIWKEILGHENIGLDDNFFELGGHSLLATRVIARVRDAFGLEAPLRLLFEAPTIAQFVAGLGRLPAADAAPHLVHTPAPPAESTAVPLSFAQQRLWFLAQLDPQSTAYNLSRTVHLRGPLDIEALRAALETIVSRHASLRTIFVTFDHEPRQVVNPPARFTLDIEDTKEKSADRDAVIARWAAARGDRPFDLQRDPMLRAGLLRLSTDEHVLTVTIHHVSSDGWSMGVFWGELSALYEAYAGGRPSPLPPLEVQYRDYAVWQREHLVGERLARQVSYWRSQLEGLSTLELPTDHPRPPRPSYRAARESFVLDPAISAEVQRLARANGATPFMVLLAAFQLLLARWAGHADVAVGTPIAGRTRELLEPLIGFFVNTLVMRADITRASSFRDLLDQVRRTALDAFDHQDLPFEKLVEELRPARDMSRNPLVQVLFALQNAPDVPLSLPGLVVSVPSSQGERVRFDLELHMYQPRDGGIMGTLTYSADLFERPRMARLVAEFETIVRSVAARPDAPFDEFRSGRAGDANVAPSPETVEEHASVPQLFEAAASNSLAIAVLDETRTVTYGELNAEANRMARLLRERGVQPDDRVALCLDRSIDALVSVLATLKAGGAYVPIDPTHPAARVAFQLQDAQPRLLITRSDLASALPHCDSEVIYLDRDRPSLGRFGGENLPQVTDANSLAYVLFTSGSTGQPKGVAMRHGPLANLIGWQQNDERLQRAARTVQFAPLTFDVSFQELFTTWCTGGTVVIVRDEVRRDFPALLRHLQHHRVERLYLPYVALRHIAETARDTRCIPDSLQDVISAGEALHLPEAVRRFVAAIPGCRLHNHYGPTETHVVTAFTLPEDTAAWPATSPIGRAISNVDIELFDAEQRRVPAGVSGEIFIGGAPLARGYLNHPELTAERFVPDPTAPQRRLYRTGDLARLLPDGNLEFLGRKDDQVKIRGFRVELGEVEAVLGAHASVRACAIAVRQDRIGDPQLVAYVVSHETSPATADLRAHMRSRLPDYMVPAAFVPMPSLPVSPNGKVDRQALPRPLDLPRPKEDGARERRSRMWSRAYGPTC